MKLTNLIIIIALIIVLILLLIKINDNKKEHLVNMNEAIKNMISLHTDNSAIFNTAKFNSVNAEQLEVTNIMNVNKGTFNNVTANNIDISNNLTGNTGNFTNINVLNNLTGITGRLRNIISTDISSNNITAESGRFSRVISESANIQRYDVSSLNINKICFHPTDITKCLTLDSFNGLKNLDNYDVNNPKNQYMYYPNIIPGAVMSESSPSTYNNNIIWSKLSDKIELSTPLNADLGKLKVIGPGEKWMQYTTSLVEYTGSNTQFAEFRTSTFNKAQPKGTGIEITVPKPPPNNPTGDYSVLWISFTNSSTPWISLKLYQYDSATENILKHFGKIMDGLQNLNKISPDGSTHNGGWNTSQWIPIPFDLSGNSSRKLVLSNFNETNTSHPMLFNAIAFSTNPWNHCKIPSVSILFQINNDDNTNGIVPSTTGIFASIAGNFSWNNNNWNNQPLGQFHGGTSYPFRIPFVNSNKDKIFYIIEHNDNWGPSILRLEIFKFNTTTQTETVINLGNFYTSFDNPFARHYNSKIWQRYYGIVIPKEHLPVKGTDKDNFIKLRIYIPSGAHFIFTEVGTHDKNSFE